MKKQHLTLILFASVLLTFAQAPNLKNDIPNSPIETVLQAPISNIDSWDSLKGKWLLLEFWATWCAPCITKIPDLNLTQKALASENIQFIAISPESIAIVKRFLKQKSISGWIGIDRDQSFIKAMKIKSYPTTVLINPQGKIHAYLDSENISKEAILNAMSNTSIETKVITQENVLTKKVISIGNTKAQKSISINDTKPHKTEVEKPVYEVSINETEKKQGSTYQGKINGQFISSSISLTDLISNAYNIAPIQIFGNEPLLNKMYNVKVVLPKNSISIFDNILQSAIKEKLKVNITKSTKKLSTYQLTAPDGVSKNLFLAQKAQNGRASQDDGVIAASNFKFSYLIGHLENILQTSISDKTGFDGSYDYNLYWDHENPNSIIKALKDQLGLVLKEKKEEKEVLIVESINL